ncbi:MAG: 2-C-methyl-D-erythritol 4-phosphate cytidylyltransferase [Proteobacteria bacterium]|nr:2-C-methyl-D-erythritol 4-phosphate cytidylyltransferase [Pseudomonadota bacterium]
MEGTFWLIIPASGTGSRFHQNGHAPKQYLKLGGKTVLEHTLQVFLPVLNIKKIVISLAKTDEMFAQLSLCKQRIHTVIGGDNRAQSVFNALCYLKKMAKAQDWVIVHDAVRFCLHPADLQKLLNEIVDDKVGGMLATPVVDTLKFAKNSQVSKTVPRGDLWHALTPQMFRFQLLYDALVYCFEREILVTDEAHALEQIGLSPKIVSAKYPNPKLTYAQDLPLMSLLLQVSKMEEVQ